MKLFKNLFNRDNYLNNKKLDFITDIDGIKIENKNALKELSFVNNDLIPKYLKCKECIANFNYNKMNSKDANDDLISIKSQIINKCNEISNALTEDDKNEVNKEYKQLHKIISN